MKLLIAFSVSLFALANMSFASDCSHLWANGYPDIVPRHTEVNCVEFSPALSPVSFGQRYFIVGEYDDAVKFQMEMVAEAVSYSTAKYAIYGRVPTLNIVRSNSAHPNSAGPSAMAFTYVEFFNLDSEACPIFVYPLSSILSKEHLQQLVAHEVFHCVQKVNFKDQVAYAANHSSEDYWFEGLAQYFSNVVYPLNDFEYTPRFPAPDQSIPFFEQDIPYSSENFWQSYANLTSEHTLWELMSQYPTHPNNLPRISEALHQYGRDITLKRVRDASGAMSPYDMLFESKILNDTNHQEVNLSHFDFVVGAFEITLPKSGKWRIRFDQARGTKISLKKSEESDYRAFDGSIEITSECDKERKIQVVLTRASAEGAMNSSKLIVDKSPNEECTCIAHPEAPPQIDQCLVGTWALDHASVEQYWNRMSRMPNTHFDGSQGGFSVTFDERNVGTWNASTWKLMATGQLSSGHLMKFVQTTNGQSTFNYSANAGVACSKQTSSNLVTTQKITIDGRSSQTTNIPSLNPANGNFTYSCDGNTFIFQVFTLGSMSQDMQYIFHRQ